jgi:dihydropteroate synthase
MGRSGPLPAVDATETTGMGSPAIDFLPDLGRRTLVMGILNLTPDSFSDGGQFNAPAVALERARALVADGADILDVGGESTRPGATEVSPEEEMRRVLPVLAEIAGAIDVPVSIDTYKASTARAALEAGARIVNDVWGLQREPEIADVVAQFGVPVVVMHNRREVDASLDIIDEMRGYFDRTLDIARQAGIAERHIILDPGIGFGKSRAQNLAALGRLDELKAFGFPVLIGTSRKSLIGSVVDRPPQERLAGTIASNVLAVAAGADIVRVHDVREHVDACRVTRAILDHRA